LKKRVQSGLGQIMLKNFILIDHCKNNRVLWLSELKATGNTKIPTLSRPKHVPATWCTKKDPTATRSRKKSKKRYNQSCPNPIAKKGFPTNSRKTIIDHDRAYKMDTKTSIPTHLLKTGTKPIFAK